MFVDGTQTVHMLRTILQEEHQHPYKAGTLPQQAGNLFMMFPYSM